MNDIDKVKAIISLTLAKLDIVKTKFAEAGYLWSMLGDVGRAEMLKAEQDIDNLINELKKP